MRGGLLSGIENRSTRLVAFSRPIRDSKFRVSLQLTVGNNLGEKFP